MKQIFIILLLLSAMITACTNVQVISSTVDSRGLTKKYTPVPTKEVIIYRTAKPENLKNYEELGTVLLNGDGPQMDYIYKQLRESAGKQGAHYIVDLKIKGQWQTRTKTYRKVDKDGKYYSVTERYQVVAYTAAGTLLRRKK